MKKNASLLLIILLLSANTLFVQAGSLNAYEYEVVNAAKGQFEVDGKLYQVDSSYVSALINYLMQDNIEITAEQRDKAIATMYSNVEKGVDDGYLIPIELPSEQGGEQKKDNQTSTTPLEEGQAVSEELTENTAENKTEEKTQKFVADIVKQPVKTTEINMGESKVTVADEDNKSVLTLNTVIKNTGFDAKGTAFVATSILVLMAVSIIITLKYDFFIQRD